MTKTNANEERMLEDIFAAARREAPEPSPALMARILADAEAVQAADTAQRAATIRRNSRRPGLFASAITALGGWGAVGGLAAATLAGVWIGFTGMGALGSTAAGLWGAAESAATVDLIPGEADFAALGIGLEG
ncbi:dihydroorotate dehydrogenase [Ostreiculturibacter nitratireducens]|uniref:dihydroorotate dehydrogenase n=1 Tax=Ostreiculturibacter nitratireducens TaxID=3075226 RepID=UPI0031B5A780